jgi:hypothetical protein
MFEDLTLGKIIIALLLYGIQTYWFVLVVLFLTILIFLVKTGQRQKKVLRYSWVSLLIVGTLIYKYFIPGYLPGCKMDTKRKVYKMPEYQVFEQKDGVYFLPTIIPMKDSVEKIFSVPVSNAIGTIDIENQITILKFNGQNIPDYDIVAKDFLSEVRGPFEYRFTDVYSDREIAYSQGRWAVIADLKNGKIELPGIANTLDDYAFGIMALDESEKIYVVNKLVPAYDGYAQKLGVVKLENREFTLTGEIDGGSKSDYITPWMVYDKKLFTYDEKKRKILCYDKNLNETIHPFAEIFNRNKEKFRRVKDMLIHPTLPFGILIEVGNAIPEDELAKLEGTPAHSDALDKYVNLSNIHALYLIRWDIEDTSKQLIPLYNNTISLFKSLEQNAIMYYGGLSLSPDRKWVVFKHVDSNEKGYKMIGGVDQPYYIALPVDSKNPLFVGEPVFLGRIQNKYGGECTTAWATDPVAFVAADKNRLLKWDLGNFNSVQPVKLPNSVYSYKY